VQPLGELVVEPGAESRLGFQADVGVVDHDRPFVVIMINPARRRAGNQPDLPSANLLSADQPPSVTSRDALPTKRR
jgi:hypothetical protein